jgi:hypothetical protein
MALLEETLETLAECSSQRKDSPLIPWCEAWNRPLLIYGWAYDWNAIRNLKVGDKDGHFIPMTQLADVVDEEGPAQISRGNGQPACERRDQCA